MFISSKEKLSLTLRVTVLEGQIAQLTRSLNALHDANTLAPKPNLVKRPKKVKSSGWTPEGREKQAERMRKYWVDKKAQVAA
jgi:hypothetical protein